MGGVGLDKWEKESRDEEREREKEMSDDNEMKRPKLGWWRWWGVSQEGSGGRSDCFPVCV